MTVIAIDGPAGSGKSTLARLLAARLGYAYLDTGAMYRAIAYLALRDGVATDDGASLAALAREARISFAADGHIVAVERDVSEEIRRPAVSAAVSEVSAHPEVRAVLVEEQRHIGAVQDIVIEGRDIGTVVFPAAPVKLFLTASAEIRAERRRRELIAGGEHVGIDETLRAITTRDAYDSQRAVAPLRRADDAVVLDTDGLDIDQVVEAARKIVLARLGASA
jgi:cytidylate kinase